MWSLVHGEDDGQLHLVNGGIGVYSSRSRRRRGGMMRRAKVSVGAAVFLQSPVGTRIAAVDVEMPWGAAVNGMVLCGSARSAVSMDGVTDQPQQMASATVLVSKRASVCTRIAAVDAEMAWCNSAENR